MKRVGIIGGMGPDATIDLFRKIVEITPALSDQEHLPLLIDNYPQIPDRTRYLKGEGESPLPYLFESIDRLERAGVDCLCMACNTAHYFIEDLRKKARVPFLSIVDAVIDEIKGVNGHKKVGLLATDGTIISGIYHSALNEIGVKVENFDSYIQKEVMSSIYSLKMGDRSKSVRLMENALKKIRGLEYTLLIAACTEVPVILSFVSSTYTEKFNIIDATLALAKKIVNLCLSED